MLKENLDEAAEGVFNYLKTSMDRDFADGRAEKLLAVFDPRGDFRGKPTHHVKPTLFPVIDAKTGLAVGVVGYDVGERELIAAQAKAQREKEELEEEKRRRAQPSNSPSFLDMVLGESFCHPLSDFLEGGAIHKPMTDFIIAPHDVKPGDMVKLTFPPPKFPDIKYTDKGHTFISIDDPCAPTNACVPPNAISKAAEKWMAEQIKEMDAQTSAPSTNLPPDLNTTISKVKGLPFKPHNLNTPLYFGTVGLKFDWEKNPPKVTEPKASIPEPDLPPTWIEVRTELSRRVRRALGVELSVATLSQFKRLLDKGTDWLLSGKILRMTTKVETGTQKSITFHLPDLHD